MTITLQRTHHPPALLLLGILVILGLALDLGHLAEELPSWPVTDHARIAHEGQKYNVDTILPKIANGQCRPIMIFSCPGGRVKILCPIMGVWVGVVLDTNTHEIVTAFPGSFDYWLRSMDIEGCIQAAQ